MRGILLGAVLAGGLVAWLAIVPSRVRTPQIPEVDWAGVRDAPEDYLEISYLYTYTRELPSDCIPKGIIEQRMNIGLDLRYVPMSVARQKKPLSLIGEPADIFMLESGEVARYQEHGLLLPIPRELLEQHCPTLVANMDRYAPWVWPGMEVDGRAYACPVALWCDGRFPRIGAWRRDLLEAVGIREAPTTIEGFTETFRRLHAAGHVGMSGDLSNEGAETAFTEIFGAFGVQPFDWMMREGEIVFGGVQPEVKPALALLREWYAAGYIHPDVVIDRWWAESWQKFEAGEVAYHNHALSPAAHLAAVPPLGPGGRGIRVHGMAGGQSLCFGAHLAGQPQKVLRVLRLLENLVTDERFYLQTHLGGNGLDAKERLRHGLSSVEALGGATVLTFTGAGPELYEAHLPDTPRYPEWGRASPVGRYDIVPELSALAQRLRREQLSLFVAIVKGQEPLETFDHYAENWAVAGAPLLRGIRKHYARQQEIVGE